MNRPAISSVDQQRGITLVELMIAMLLGLVVVGGAIGVVLSGKQAYRATEQLSRAQENARVAFELMAREIRETAGTPCGKSLPVANILVGAQGAGADWWMKFADGLHGYEDGVVGEADAIDLMSGESSGVTVVSHDRTPGNAGSPANFKVNTIGHGIKDEDVIMVCDYTQASILQVSSAGPSNVTVVFNKGNGTPGNCTKGLGYPVVCTANGNQKAYGQNSTIVKLRATRWYIAKNPNGRNSLYRATMSKGVPTAGDEVVEGVEDMQLEYLVLGKGYKDANAVVAWGDVVAVRVTLEFKGDDKVGVDGTVLTRTVSHVVNLRNRTS